MTDVPLYKRDMMLGALCVCNYIYQILHKHTNLIIIILINGISEKNLPDVCYCFAEK